MNKKSQIIVKGGQPAKVSERTKRRIAAGVKTLNASMTEAMDRYSEAASRRADLWRGSRFRDLLVDNLMSSKPVAESGDPDFDGLRLYRGQGAKIDLISAGACKCGKCPKGNYHLYIAVDYASDEYNEKTVRHTLSVPSQILNSPSKASFRAWANTARRQRVERERKDLATTVSRFESKYKVKI